MERADDDIYKSVELEASRKKTILCGGGESSPEGNLCIL